jgi:hypothetical protein
VSSSRRRTLIVLAVAAIAGIAAGIAIGLGEDDGSEPAPGSAVADTSTRAEPATTTGDSAGTSSNQADSELPPPEDDPEGAEPGPSGPPPETSREEAAATAARGYIQALDRRAGAAVCRAFVPGALDPVEFPEARGSCPATIEASLGFERRGRPVWEGSEMTEDVSAKVTGDAARVVATIFTVYADVREPTIEDDIIFLAASGDHWLVAKPSLTLHRAIGDADPPPSALTPP